MSHKEKFIADMHELTKSLTEYVSVNGGYWSIKGLIDAKENIFPLSLDTKIISKILEIQLLPKLQEFADEKGYKIILAEKQNWYPDISFVNKSNSEIKFAVDIKTTYRDPEYEGQCNGFTLGSHGEYFQNRASTKNIQFPYNSYCGHIILGVIYSRVEFDDKTNIFQLENLESINSVINEIMFFIVEKWKIASDKSGSGNTANIGSIKNIKDILSGNGTFAKAGEKFFDEYWVNYNELKENISKRSVSFKDFLEFKNEDIALFNPRPRAKKIKGDT